MKIGSISEDLTSEKRISLIPELSKKYLDLGVDFFINKNYGTHLGFFDYDFKKLVLTFSFSYSSIPVFFNIFFSIFFVFTFFK